MNVVFLHCHFERGGVTQVVENQVAALTDGDHQVNVWLASGSRQSGLTQAIRDATSQFVIDDFDYDRPDCPPRSAASRGRAIADALSINLSVRGLHADNTILHWHNHSLGKNTAAPAVIAELARAGWRFVLQLHDFAEDNRPANYLGLLAASGAASPAALDRYLYPVADQIHYAALTRADRRVLIDLGVPDDLAHCLPNSVAGNATAERDHDAALAKVRRLLGLGAQTRWCLYPVRGIRRKNIGEFVLLSRWLADQTCAGLTLRPTTPVEADSYDRWQAIAAESSPRAIFDAGEHPELTYAENLAASDFALSTSVAEGFGMTYLEPWLAGRPVIARRLATVTDDFIASGVVLPQLYESIPVPGSERWREQVRQETHAAWSRAWSAIPVPFRPRRSDMASESSDDAVDFAELVPARQADLIRRAAFDPGYEAELRQRSATLMDALQTSVADDLVKANADVIGRVYSQSRCRAQLLDLYDRVQASELCETLDGPADAGSAATLISRVRPFYPCRTEVPDHG